MKGLAPLFLGIFGTFAFSWVGLTVIPNWQIGHLNPQSDEEGTDIYPMPQSGMVARGARVYAANGCNYCHSQQVRADYSAADIERKWGDRRSAPRDYIFERPVFLAKMRMGQDLANIGARAPKEEESAPAAPPGAASPAASPAPQGGAPAPSVAPSGASPSPAAGAASPSPAGSPATQTAAISSSPPPGGSPPPATSPVAPPAAATSPAPNASPTPKPAGSPPPASSPPVSPAAAASSPAPGASPTPKPAGSPPPAGSPATSPSAPHPNESPASPPATVAAGGSPAAPSAPWPEVTTGEPPMYSAAWHHVHLYSPRSINVDSIMPSYRFLYQTRRISDAPSAEALHLTGSDAPADGWEIVPTFDARCLVAYLMSLNQSHPLKEVRSGAPPAAGSPAPSPAPAPAK
jgi:cbb3-type cytochrome oxidase cytochrome c subunit